jgi:hypothetical protein
MNAREHDNIGICFGGSGQENHQEYQQYPESHPSDNSVPEGLHFYL